MDEMSQVLMRQSHEAHPSPNMKISRVRGSPDVKKMSYNFTRWSHTLVKILSPWGSCRP